MALIFPTSSWLPSRFDQQPSCVLRVKVALGFEGKRPISLYMILYIRGGHTAGCAALAFVCLQ